MPGEAEYMVLANKENQHCLWLADTKVPAGWVVVYERGSREACLDYVRTNWLDMRPRSLVENLKSKLE